MTTQTLDLGLSLRIAPNESDFQKIKLRQRVAVDMRNRTTKTKMIGQDVAMPVALAPTGLTGMQHADGEILAARAAEKFGVPFCLSNNEYLLY
jgi:L-lactate dehydrogenase (cytochrome)